MVNAQEWLNKNYPLLIKEKKEKIKELDLSGWNEKDWQPKPNWEKLTGELDLSDFPNLEKLDCSYNEIISLNLVNCPKLTELKCWDNQLTEIKFPKSQLNLKILYAWTNYLTEIDWKVFNSETLTCISISNNDLQEENIGILSKFANLEELYLATDILDRLEERKYNRFHGSLKKLVENCKQLKKLQIEGTGVEEDLKHLPKDLEITSWHKKNSMVAKIIPLERLCLISGNIKNFLRKWGVKESKLSELSNLQSPKELWKYKIAIYGTKFISQVSTVAGTALTLQEDGIKMGIGVLAIAPFSELMSWKLEENLKDKEEKWKEFLLDAGNFLDNYSELSGILSQFEKSGRLKGKVNRSIKILNEKMKEFLKIYDEDSNQEIDINELTNKRNELIRDLNKGKDSEVREIVDAIKVLEEATIEYRKFSYYYEEMQERGGYRLQEIDLDKWEKETKKLETSIEIPPK